MEEIKSHADCFLRKQNRGDGENRLKVIAARRFSCIILSICIPLILSGCATIYNPATSQQEFIFITTPLEVSIGKMLSTKISSEFDISKDPKIISNVEEIGKKVSKVSDRRDIEYHFAVIEDDTFNAFTMPGGYIYINSGLIKEASNDELASVIAHEIGHVAARHIAKKLQAQIGYDILMNIATSKSSLGELEKAASLSYDLIMLGYSREDELLADTLAVKYTHRAGFDPYAMISMLQKIKDAKEDEIGPIFLRSHPYISQRIKLLEKKIPGIIEKDKEHLISTPTVVIPKSLNTKSNLKKVMCPVCKRILPCNANYCPYDGTKLQ